MNYDDIYTYSTLQNRIRDLIEAPSAARLDIEFGELRAWVCQPVRSVAAMAALMDITQANLETMGPSIFWFHLIETFPTTVGLLVWRELADATCDNDAGAFLQAWVQTTNSLSDMADGLLEFAFATTVLAMEELYRDAA